MRSSNRFGPLLLAALSVSLQACGSGQAKVEAKADTGADASVDFDAEGTRASRTPEGTSSTVNAAEEMSAPGTSGGPALLGARHDVRLKDPGATVACECLSLAAGSPTAPLFVWSGEPPTIDPSTQLVVVLDSDGAPCSSSKAPSASYRGYSVENGETIIELEAAQAGRPMTRGAIVPRPTSGQIRVRAPKSLPYGKALSGSVKI